MTSPEGGVEWGRLISHLSSWDNPPLPTAGPFIDLCVPWPAHLCPSQSFVDWSSPAKLFSDSHLFSALMPAGVGSCFPLSSPVQEGIGDWLSSVGAVGSWSSSQVWPWRQEKCPWPRVSEGWLLERAAGLEVDLWPLPRDCLSLIKLLLECN